MPAEHPRTLIIDTDPGLDDAIALWLALASPELHVEAVLAVAGNVGLPRTLANASAIVALAGRETPVHAGADRPLVGPAVEATHVHGADGLGAVRLPPGRPAAPGLAADMLRERLRRAHAPVTLVGIGPATNLALALATEPSLVRHVDEIVLMSGADGPGNITAHAEFNAHADPEALAIVLAAGVTVTFATLDLTAQALIEPADLDALRRRRGGACLEATIALLDAMPAQSRYDGRPVHDACAVAWLLRPDLFAHRPVRARTILDGAERGRTLFAPPDAACPPNARLLTSIDRTGFLAVLGDTIAALP